MRPVSSRSLLSLLFTAAALIAWVTATPASGAPAAAAPAPAAKVPGKRAPAPRPRSGAAAPAQASNESFTRPTSSFALRTGALAPVTGEVVSTHSPFAESDCDFCHRNKDPKNPGPLRKPITSLCGDCHDDLASGMRAHSSKHPPALQSCSNCHNAHNAKHKGLLLVSQEELCAGCHPKVKALMDGAKVKHLPVVEGDRCLNCHNPHSTNVEKMLIDLPFDLCVKCHSQDGMKDPAGTKLTNFKKLLAENSVHHAPVAGKDCSACHVPHGNDNFRLLVEAYPEKFYAAYAAENYALCFECHNPDMLAAPVTTTLTQFRDGSRNLHYLHCNKPDKGRTCRACHEVHASPHPAIVRDAVPYGNRGWMLRINFTKTPTGGSCERTCHRLKPYDNTSKTAGKR
jgi:predicted CXXCH cytochrome family protein